MLSTGNENSAQDIRMFEQERRLRAQQLFEKAEEALRITNLKSRDSRNYGVYNKDKLRKAMRNPMASQQELRHLSRYLYRMSHPYRRIIHYFAEMIDLKAQVVIPFRDLTKTENTKKYIKNYYASVKEVEKIDLASEIFKCLVIAWLEDTFYGVTYEDDTGFFILPLDGDYCRVSSVNYDGTLNFAFDMMYFTSHPDLLEYYGEPFTSMNRIFELDKTTSWVEVPTDRSICFKVNIDDILLPIPPFVGLFEELIDLIDLRSIQNVKDELSIYKLLVAKMETFDSGLPDDFKVDPNTATKYYNLMIANLPPEIAAALAPYPIELLDFNTDQTNDVNRMEAATKNLFSNSGGAQVLYSTNISGTTAFEAAIRADSEHALSALLPQLQKWINHYLTCVMGKHSQVVYLEVTPYTKEWYKASILKDAQYGIPVKMAVAALDGFSPLETLSMQHLENDILKLHDEWIPLQSSFTRTSAGVGTTTKRVAEGDTDPETGGRPTEV